MIEFREVKVDEGVYKIMILECIMILQKNTKFRKYSFDGHDQIRLQPKSVVGSQTEVPSGFPI